MGRAEERQELVKKVTEALISLNEAYWIPKVEPVPQGSLRFLFGAAAAIAGQTIVPFSEPLTVASAQQSVTTLSKFSTSPEEMAYVLCVAMKEVLEKGIIPHLAEQLAVKEGKGTDKG